MNNELREKVVRILDLEGAQTGECGHEPGDMDECENGCRELLLHYADALAPIFAEIRAQALQDAREDQRSRAERAEARIAAALDHDPLHGNSDGLHCGGMAPCIRRILTGEKES
jgi:hypothetical protein